MFGKNNNEIRLPNPQISAPLASLINNRASTKEYADKPLNEQLESDILWAAFGRNKKNTRTIPTAMNEKNLKVYVLKDNGAWLYDGEENTLSKITDANLLPLVEQQDYVKSSGLNLVYTGSDTNYSALHAGAAYENVYLTAVEKGLGTVARAFIDKDALKKGLNLKNDEFVIIHQFVGYPLEKD